MPACFHGGVGSGMKSINIIRDLAKNMKAMSLKVKAGGGGSHARARRRRPEAEEDLQLQDKDIAAAAAASAKIAPAQVHEADDPSHGSDSHHPHKEELGGKRLVHCDKCCSHLDDVAEEEEEAAAVATGHAAGEESDREWVAEPEPGVLMTLVSRPDGTNHLRRLRFREELFDGPRAAQRWWADNYDSIVELYSIVQSGGGSYEDDAEVDDEGDEPVTPCQSEDDHRQPRRWQRLGCDSASTSGPSSGSGAGSASTLGSPILGLVVATPKSSTREREAQAQRHQTSAVPCTEIRKRNPFLAQKFAK